jgi:TAG lipase/steryl ester hydrolase/phospholipase A2/LPA acyltransferase
MSNRTLIARRRKDLDQAQDYRAWREIALELDRLEGGEVWKQDEVSEDYDYLLIKERLAQMRELRRRGDARRLAHELAEGLHGNLGNIANPLLYAYCRVGTKALIEEYVAEVARCLDYLCVGDFPDFSTQEKIVFFKRTGASFGRSALLLSGGATLGMFHLGVIKALWEHNLLPRVITGSSAGAIIAAMVGTRNDEELPALFDPAQLDLQAFSGLSLRQALRRRALMDPARLAACLERNIRPGTFLEAFERTRRILGVSVSPAQPNQSARLLNYLTAPSVLVRSAVLASCAVPGVFPPVMLQAQDYSGAVVPYLRSKRWIDGTIAHDLPMLRLARLHNVNHYLVSQTNPHVVPFLRAQDPHRRGLLDFARQAVAVFGRDALLVARQYVRGGAGGRIVDALNAMLQQRYSGDVSIVPRQTPAQLLRMFSNLQPEDLRRLIREGERATWPKLERIRVQTRISRALEDCLAWLKDQDRARPQRAGRPRALPSAR